MPKRKHGKPKPKRDDILIRDQLGESFEAFFRRNADEIEHLRRSEIQLIKARMQRRLGAGLVPASEANEKLRLFCDTLVTPKDKRHLAGRTVYEWLALDRRMSASGFPRTCFARPNSAALAKIFSSNIIYRYGAPVRTRPSDLANDYNFSFDDFMLAYRVEIYGVALQQLSAMTKTTAKGLDVDSTEPHAVSVPDPATELAIETFDDDNEDAPDFMAVLGLLDSPSGHISDLERQFTEGHSILAATPVPDRAKLNMFGMHFDQPHFAIGRIDLTSVYTNVRDCDNARDEDSEGRFKSVVGVDCLSWLKGVSHSCSFVGLDNRVMAFASITKTGYRLITKEHLADLRRLHPELSAEDFEKFLAHATHSEKEAERSLLSLMPRSFLLPLGDDAFLVDFTRTARYVVETLTSFYKRVGYDTDAGRGTRFENQATERLGGRSDLKVLGKNLKLFAGGEQIVEIDILVEVAGALVALDCKSVVYDPTIDEGDAEILRRRTGDNVYRCGVRDERVQRLRDRPHGDNYDFRGKTLLSHLLVAGPEWLPPSEPTAWWDKGIPRISTIESFLRRTVPWIKRSHPVTDVPPPASA